MISWAQHLTMCTLTIHVLVPTMTFCSNNTYFCDMTLSVVGCVNSWCMVQVWQSMFWRQATILNSSCLPAPRIWREPAFAFYISTVHLYSVHHPQSVSKRSCLHLYAKEWTRKVRKYDIVISLVFSLVSSRVDWFTTNLVILQLSKQEILLPIRYILRVQFQKFSKFGSAAKFSFFYGRNLITYIVFNNLQLSSFYFKRTIAKMKICIF